MIQKFLHGAYLRFFVVLSILWVLFSPSFLFAYVSPGKPTGYVNDFAQILTIEQKSVLENRVRAFNASTTNELAIVTVKNLSGEYIEGYAEALFKEWMIGTAKRDNGVLLLVALDDHRVRIEVGYGLEGALTDMLAYQIIRQDITPAFKQEDFYRGISLATEHIIQATEGEYQAIDETSSKKSQFPFFEVIIFIFVFLIQFFGSILSRSKSWWAGGVIGGIAGGALIYFGVLQASLILEIALTIVLVLIGLIFDFIVSSSYASALYSGSSIPWWAGGNSRGSGGSFGGFGGGSSGGGGASGSW